MASITNTKGVDISSNNGNIDLAKVKKAGYGWVMIRCGFGDDISSQDDSQFEANVKKAEALGMPWGAYFYSYSLNSTQDKSELKHILRLLKGKKPTLPIAIDVEDADGYKSRNGGWNYSNVNRNCKYLLEGLAKNGYYPMLYTGFEEIENYISSDVWKKYDMWFAHWAKKCGYTGNNLCMWQYGGETNVLESNSIAGVGTIDKDYVYKDYPSIIKSGGYNNWNVTKKPVTSTNNSTPNKTTTSTTNKNKPIIYTQGVSHGKWLNVIKEGTGYSGTLGKPLVAFASKVSSGTITYSIHVKGGSWLGNVTGFNYKDYKNGYAGDGYPAQYSGEIDGVKMYYKTPENVKKKYGTCKVAYRVHIKGGKWLDWQYDTETSNGQDGYAGIFGKTIDGLQAKIVKA